MSLLKTKGRRINLKRIIVTTAIIISTLILTGCGHSNIAAKQQAQNPSVKDQTVNGNSQKTQNGVGKAAPQQPSAQNSSNENAAIVAKSENVMSSSDKEALLNQVDKELDSLFNNINNLEDPQDADLDLNQK